VEHGAAEGWGAKSFEVAIIEQIDRDSDDGADKVGGETLASFG
jgi:hypothetical protein